jgi:hypothetical protein
LENIVVRDGDAEPLDASVVIFQTLAKGNEVYLAIPISAVLHFQLLFVVYIKKTPFNI